MIARQHPVRVRSAGEYVVLSFGNWQRELHYETAILLAYWMQRRAREAKVAAGRAGLRLRAIGTLHDASAKRREPFTPGKLYPARREVLRLAQIEVLSRGAEVLLRFPGAEVGLPWGAAIVIAQWVRLAAKEAKARCGDVGRHWSLIASEHERRAGPLETRG